jgi:ribosomal protein S1
VFWTRLRQLQAEDVAMTVRVTAANRGGLMCQFHHIEGFIPSSHFGQVCNGVQQQPGEQCSRPASSSGGPSCSAPGSC